MSGSVTAVTQMWSRRGGSYTSERFNTFPNNWTLTEAYCVVCTVDTDIKTIRNATGVPQHGDAHATEAGTYVESVQPEQVSPILWIVTVGYVGIALDAGDIDVDWTDTATSEPIDRDYDGNAILTANGEQIEGLTVEVPDQVVVIRRKFTTINTYSIAAYRRSTNSDEFLGWPPGTARLVGFQAKNRFKFGAPQELWDVTARIQFRDAFMGATPEQAWYKRWRHEGMYVKVDGVIQRARDPLGQETSRPVLLKLDGTQETNAAAALFKYTKVFGSLAYSGLGLL
jgi:hypothetical protein